MEIELYLLIAAPSDSRRLRPRLRLNTEHGGKALPDPPDLLILHTPQGGQVVNHHASDDGQEDDSEQPELGDGDDDLVDCVHFPAPLTPQS